MRLSLKTAGLAALSCILIGAASAQPGGRFGAAVDAAADGCLGAATPKAASAAVRACAGALAEVSALGKRLAPEALGSPEFDHYLARRAAIELRISALQGDIEGKAHSDVCHWAAEAAGSAAGVALAHGDTEAEAAYRPVLNAASDAFAACAPVATGDPINLKN